MPQRVIAEQGELDALCERLRRARRIGIDTEFVTEHTYRPVLCLVQVAYEPQGRQAGDGDAAELAVVDPFAADLTAFWQNVAEAEMVAHAAAQEARFCLRAAGRLPRRIVDTQVAAGLIGPQYPGSYGNLVYSMLGSRVRGRQTRTDWRRRPLSRQQVDYALEDVRHLLPLWDCIAEELARRGRTAWADEEFARLAAEIAADADRPRWRRLSGIQSLGPRELAAARELFAWREREAERRDQPVQRVLRDDLIVELARLRPRTAEQLHSLRGMDRRDFRQLARELLAALRIAECLPEEECPQPARREDDRGEQVLGQFLALVLAGICTQEQVAAALVATAADLRVLVRRHRIGSGDGNNDDTPLDRGWRAELVGDRLRGVLEGRVRIRVGDAASRFPLVFEEVEGE